MQGGGRRWRLPPTDQLRDPTATARTGGGGTGGGAGIVGSTMERSQRKLPASGQVATEQQGGGSEAKAHVPAAPPLNRRPPAATRRRKQGPGEKPQVMKRVNSPCCALQKRCLTQKSQPLGAHQARAQEQAPP